MEFTTLQEYFYKLRNVLYTLLLLPLLSFIYLLVSSPAKPEGIALLDENLLFVKLALSIIVVVDWLAATLVFNSMVTNACKLPGLRAKLERYHTAIVMRYGLHATSCIVLALGLYLTGDNLFSALFGVALVLAFALWPKTSKVCRDLKLKGDEREMVFYKKNSF